MAHTIKRSDLRELLPALGIEWGGIRKTVIKPFEIRVHRIVRDENGKAPEGTVPVRVEVECYPIVLD